MIKMLESPPLYHKVFEKIHDLYGDNAPIET